MNDELAEIGSGSQERKQKERMQKERRQKERKQKERTTKGAYVERSVCTKERKQKERMYKGAYVQRSVQCSIYPSWFQRARDEVKGPRQ